MFSFEYRERSFCPYFAQTHHMPINIAANAFVASIKSRIATASKNSTPNKCLIETSGVLLTMSASIALHLITTQMLSGCLAAVQPLVNEFCALRTTKSIFLGQIVKAVFFRSVGKLNGRNISCNAQQFQAAMNGTGIVATIQCNVLHRDPVLNLPLQMPQNQQTFFFICRIHVHAGYNPIFTVYCSFHQVSDTTLFFRD